MDTEAWAKGVRKRIERINTDTPAAAPPPLLLIILQLFNLTEGECSCFDGLDIK